MRCHKHGGEPTPVYMHGRCHPRAKNKVSLDEDVLTVSCSECNSVIVEASIVQNASHRHTPQGAQSCEKCPGPPGMGIWTLYQEGDLYVICTGCDKPMTILEVQPCPIDENLH
jgi:hypothetical protein